MSFDWREYLALAKNLARNTHSTISTEAYQRVAISRAYYSAFCKARNFARDRGEITLANSGSDHNTVKEHFRKADNESDPTAKQERQQIGLQLNRLRSKRNKADYEDNISNTSRLTSLALKQADKVLTSLDTI